MHLEGPWLSTTGKRKGKQKFRSAEQAKRHREVEESWAELQHRWGVEQQERKKKTGLERPEYRSPKMNFRGCELLNKPSLNSGSGVAAKKETMTYTGSSMKGIGTLHKSNAVPVFTDDEAKEISSMRR